MSQDYISTFYFFNDGYVIELMHHSYNLSAAERAMLKAYDRSASEIKRTADVAAFIHDKFDGRNY